MIFYRIDNGVSKNLKEIKMKKIFFLILLLFFGVACSGDNKITTSSSKGYEQNGVDFSGGGTPEFVLRYAENQALDYPTTLGALKFAELVDKKTNGRIKIKVYPNAELGDEQSVIEQMQFGSIDFARSSLGTLAEFSTVLNVLQLPYLYRDEAHMWSVLDGKIGENFLDIVGGFGLVGLSWYDAGSRSFYSTKEIKGLDDLKGLNIRVQDSSMMKEMIRSLNANPIAIVFSEVYFAFQRGIIDCAENNLPSYESMKHYEVAKYFLLDEHTRVPEMQTISKKTMERLSESDFAIIRECAKESAKFEREQWTKREKESLKKVIDNGAIIIELSEAEKQKFREICKTLYDKNYSEYLDIIEKIANTETSAQ